MSQSRPPVARIRALLTAAVESGPSSRNFRAIAAGTALLGAVPLAATRLALNSPFRVPGVASGEWYELARLAAVVGPATAAIVLGVTTDRELTRVGLLSVGVFGLLSTMSPAAAVPTVAALVAGGWLIIAGRLDRRPGRPDAVAVALVAGLTLSLLGAIGYHPVTFRSAGTTVALLGIAASPLAVGVGRRGLAVGGLVAAGTYALITHAPFVSGAVALAAGAAVDPSGVLLALGVAGPVATSTEGLVSRRLSPAIGGGLLLAAGIPASVPRAVPATVAVALLLAAAPGGDST